MSNIIIHLVGADLVAANPELRARCDEAWVALAATQDSDVDDIDKMDEEAEAAEEMAQSIKEEFNIT